MPGLEFAGRQVTVIAASRNAWSAMFHGPSPRDLPSPQAAHRATCWDVNPHWARPINRSEAATMASLPDRSSSELTGVSRRTRVRTFEQRHRPAIPRRSHRLSTRESISAIVSVAGFCVGATSQGPGVARESHGSRKGVVQDSLGDAEGALIGDGSLAAFLEDAMPTI